MAKLKEKEKAIMLRRKGFSYREILEKIPVAKSTLSLWLREVGLSKKQKYRLTEKRIIARSRGAKRKKQIRIHKEMLIRSSAAREIPRLCNRDLWLIGVIMYWAEGAKQKEHNVSQCVRFSNSDPYFIKLFLLWLRKAVTIPHTDIKFELAIHENGNIRRAQRYWSRVTGFPLYSFRSVQLKRNKSVSYRRNRGENYFGLLRVVVKRSTDLNRKITGWCEGIRKRFNLYWGVV